MKCPNDEELLNFIEGKTSEFFYDKIVEHLSWCKKCKESIEGLKEGIERFEEFEEEEKSRNNTIH